MNSINNVDAGLTHTGCLIPDVLFHPGPTYRPPLKPIRSNMPRSWESSQSSPSTENINPDSNLDLRKILHVKEKLFLKLIQKFLPKQADMDKILKVIQRKVLKGIHLPVEIKENQAGYLNSSHFKNIYPYLSQNKLPTSKASIRKDRTLAERYILEG